MGWVWPPARPTYLHGTPIEPVANSVWVPTRIPPGLPVAVGGAVVVGFGAVVVGCGAVVVGCGAVVVGCGAVVVAVGVAVLLHPTKIMANNSTSPKYLTWLPDRKVEGGS